MFYFLEDSHRSDWRRPGLLEWHPKFRCLHTHRRTTCSHRLMARSPCPHPHHPCRHQRARGGGLQAVSVVKDAQLCKEAATAFQ
jgi:hypothetical protein